MAKEKTELDFFSELREATEKEFKESHLNDKGYSYSICGTPIIKKRPIIFGINWGGHEGDIQYKMPTAEEANKINAYRFIGGIKRYLDNQFGLNFKEPNFNYTNLCFFRTPTADDLQFADIEHSIPLFRKYVEFIEPPWLLSASMENFDYLKSNLEEINGYVSAKLWGYNIFFVPHPSAILSDIKKQPMWTAAIKEMKRLGIS